MNNHLSDWYIDPMDIMANKVIDFMGKKHVVNSNIAREIAGKEDCNG